MKEVFGWVVTAWAYLFPFALVLAGEFWLLVVVLENLPDRKPESPSKKCYLCAAGGVATLLAMIVVAAWFSYSLNTSPPRGDCDTLYDRQGPYSDC